MSIRGGGKNKINVFKIPTSYLLEEVEALLQRRWFSWGPEAETHPLQNHCRSDSMDGFVPNNTQQYFWPQL